MVLSKRMSFPYSLFNQWKFIDSLPLCAGGDIGEINRFTKKGVKCIITTIVSMIKTMPIKQTMTCTVVVMTNGSDNHLLS